MKLLASNISDATDANSYLEKQLELLSEELVKQNAEFYENITTQLSTQKTRMDKNIRNMEMLDKGIANAIENAHSGLHGYAQETSKFVQRA